MVSGKYGRFQQTHRKYQNQFERRLEFYQGHNGRRKVNSFYK
jgi:hypothetical protein